MTTKFERFLPHCFAIRCRVVHCLQPQCAIIQVETFLLINVYIIGINSRLKNETYQYVIMDTHLFVLSGVQAPWLFCPLQMWDTVIIKESSALSYPDSCTTPYWDGNTAIDNTKLNSYLKNHSTLWTLVGLADAWI